MVLNKNKLYWHFKRKQRKLHIRGDGYSQYGQDRNVFDLLGQPSAGIFIDIGANDGASLSNTLLFEEHGWTGICVEPHPDIFKTLSEKRKCHLVNACIADTDGIVDFVVVDGCANMLSGIEEFFDERHKRRIDDELAEMGGSKRTIEIEALSPQTLLKRFNISRVDYLSIDTEGCELAILKNFDFTHTFINVISVENGNRSPSVFHHLNSVGFRLHKCVGSDEIYMHR